jgi:Fic family protein
VLIRLLDLLPFGRGNGITARIYSNYFLLRSGYPPAVISGSLASQYAGAIQNALHYDTQGIIDLINQATMMSMAFCLGEPELVNPFRILES